MSDDAVFHARPDECDESAKAWIGMVEYVATARSDAVARARTLMLDDVVDVFPVNLAEFGEETTMAAQLLSATATACRR